MNLRGLSIPVLLGICASVAAVHEPRIDAPGEPPSYQVACPPNATDAGQCAVDQLVYDGWKTFTVDCQQCHGGGGLGSTFAPNLLVRFGDDGVDFGRFLYVMDNGYRGQVGAMPSMEKNPRVQKNKLAIYAYLKARADGLMPNGRPPKATLPPADPAPAVEATAVEATTVEATTVEATTAAATSTTAAVPTGEAEQVDHPGATEALIKRRASAGVCMPMRRACDPARAKHREKEQIPN